MKKIPLTQGKFALVDDEDFERLSQFKWYTLSARRVSTQYAVRNEQAGEYSTYKQRKQVRMQRYILNYSGPLEVDHKNGNGLDNRKENLRVCSGQQNRVNRGPSKCNKTKLKGVTRYYHKFAAKIRINKKLKHLGYFFSPQEAALAYNAAAKAYHGEFAKLNNVKEV